MAGQGGQEAGRVAERPVGVELELEQVLAQEDHDLRPGQDPDVGRQPQLQREFADQPVAERVERGDRRVRVAVGHELVDPDLHLGGGLVGEGQGQDLRRPGGPRGDQPGDPAGDDLGLAGARPGDHEERTAAMDHGPALLRIEAMEQGLEAFGRPLATLRRRREDAPGVGPVARPSTGAPVRGAGAHAGSAGPPGRAGFRVAWVRTEGGMAREWPSVVTALASPLRRPAAGAAAARPRMATRPPVASRARPSASVSSSDRAASGRPAATALA